ncbi:putative membrane protein YeaQ/YmgE (transglycosylase-associated protein family) [Bradyrhizobium sp. i1.3.1]
MSIIWTIIIGFVAGVIAKFIMPGDNEPSGFILTTILGIVGAFVATYLWPVTRLVSARRRRRAGGGGRGRHHRAFCLRFCGRSQSTGYLTAVTGNSSRKREYPSGAKGTSR